MLQNASVTAFTVSELLRKNQQGRGGGGITPPHPTRIRLKIVHGLMKVKTEIGNTRINITIVIT